MDKYQKLKEDTHNNIDKLMENLRSVEKLQDILSGKNQIQYKTVEILGTDYTVGYKFVNGEIEIQSIDTITDIEDAFKDRFVTMAIDGVEEQIRAEKAGEKEYKGEMQSDSSRGN